MSFTTKEQEIIKWGIANGKSKEQVMEALTNFRIGITPQKTVAPTTENAPTEKGYVDKIIDKTGTSLYERSERVGDIMKRPDTGLGIKGLQIVGQGAGLGADIIESTVGEIPGVKQAVGAFGSGINWLATSKWSPIKHLGDLIGESKVLQEAVTLYDTDQDFKDTVDATSNLVRLGGDVEAIVGGANFAKNVTEKVLNKVKGKTGLTPVAGEGTKALEAPVNIVPKTTTKPIVETPIGKTATNIVKDVTPTRERFINTEVTKALDLTQGDVKNIYMKTGNDVGKFIADKNLIGNNLIETVEKIDNFYNETYKAVRSEIKKVKTVYEADSVPTYKEALTQIKGQISDVAGLQRVNKEVDALLGKQTINLSDVQRVKELLDDQFQLYKATGEPKVGREKQGLTNIRKELRSFIEDEVKKNTGADIKALNNDVSTARSISDAIEMRSTRGLTRATISAADIVTFFAGSTVASPLGGAIAVLLKKIYQSPTFKLRFAKWLDDMSDVQKLKVKQDLENGIIPKNMPEELKPQESSKIPSNQEKISPNPASMDINNTTTNVNKDFTSKTLPQTQPESKGIIQSIKDIPNKQGGFANIGKMAEDLSGKGKGKGLHPEDKSLLTDFIDYVRLGKAPEAPDISERSWRVIEDIFTRLGISLDSPLEKLAKYAEDLITGAKDSSILYKTGRKFKNEK